MPISKTLDLEAWSKFSPKERSDDFEYNLLLFKFKSLFNEVKNYQENHSDCSVTRANLATDSLHGQRNLSYNSSSSINKTHKFSSVGHDVISAMRKPFASQNVSNQATSRSFEARSNFLRQHHLNHDISSSNLRNDTQLTHPNANSLSNDGSNLTSRKPEIKRRNLAYNFLHSKSNERLDSINNNDLSLSSSFKTNDLSNFNSKNYSTPLARNNQSLLNDSNIYDAVSPDDLPSNEIPIKGIASSIHDINRASLQQKTKLESSKSSLGLGSSLNHSDEARGSKSSSIRNVPYSSYNPERSNNSLGSSLVLDTTNNSSSSLSLLASLPSKNTRDLPHYANYVNIDFFLKRTHSPSIGGVEDSISDDTSSVSEDETTNISHSLSSDQICDEILTDLSQHKIARQLSSHETTNSSHSITPSSSGDYLEEHKNASIATARGLQTSSKINESVCKASNISRDLENDNLHLRQSSAGPRDANNRTSSSQIALKSIQENAVGRSTPIDANHLDKDGSALVEAHNTMRSFLSELNLSPVDVFGDKAQRRIVKESFAVEFCGRRKLRHLFLFNDVIVCAKYQASSKQKFTFDVKWYLNLDGVSILDPSDASKQVKYDKEVMENQILAIRTNLLLLRGQMQHIKRSKHKQPSKIIKKLKKKRTELEAELVLLLPHLPLVIKHLNGKKYTFFLSSNFDRNQWIESIKFLQSQLSPSKGSITTPSSSELQAWIQTCRKNLNPSLGTFLLRSNCDDDLLYGDLYINLNSLQGISRPGSYFFCFEVDSYGHFSQKASSTVVSIDSANHNLADEYVFPLDGAHTLRILLYEDLGMNVKPSVVGKAQIELSRGWFLDKPVEKLVVFNSTCSLTIRLSYSSSELLSMRVPHAKLCPTFGTDITQVCKKEKTNVPLLVQLCVNEVERRGMREVGIYRMSGTSTDIQRLKKAFETNPYVAELLLRDIDINSVTGFLKTYLREIPEGLFSNKLYLKFVATFNIPQTESSDRTKKMLELFHMIPPVNQHTIVYLVEHLVKVNKYENFNKMSLTNLATVLGPNILKPPSDTGVSSSDPFTAVVIGSMSQAGILYFFLNRKFSNLPLTELDSSEINPAS